MAKPTVIELFCGAGGTSLGFQQAGFDVRLGLDVDAQAIETFRLNHPSAIGLHDSVEAVTGKQLLRLAGLDEVDVLVGGPSCQGYSTIGPRLEGDPRNFLFTHYLRLVGELRPKWIVFENVKGMKFHGRGKFFEQLCRELGDLGYNIASDVVNAADYGVPQRRERLIVVGTRLRQEVALPLPSHEDPRCSLCARPDRSNRVRNRNGVGLFAASECPRCLGSSLEPRDGRTLIPWISVEEAIGDLPVLEDCGGTLGFERYSKPAQSDYQRLMRVGSKGYTLHKARAVSKFAFSVIKFVQEGKGIRSIPLAKLPKRFKVMRTISDGSLRQDCTTLYHRLSRRLPAYTITCSFTNVASGAFVHPLANRAITIREAARLQGFPDSFKFSESGVKNQIGNAVPPILAARLAEYIRRALTSRRSSKQETAKQHRSARVKSETQVPDRAERQGSLALL